MTAEEPEFDDVFVRVVRKCLDLASDGTIFPEWEFDTLFGWSISDVKALAETWPRSDLPGADALALAVGALANLLSYPGIDARQLEERTGATTEQLVAYLGVARTLLEKETRGRSGGRPEPG